MSQMGSGEASRMTEAIENRIKSIAKQVFNEVPNDREIEGLIISRDSQNRYTVKVNNAEYTNILQERSLGQIEPNTVVKIKVPNNQMNNMYICGVVDGSIATLSGGSDSSSLPVGSIITSTCEQSNAGLHLADGSNLTIGGIYDAFCQYVIANSSKFPTCTLDEWNNDISTYGQCGKYVITDTYVKLPKITKMIESANSASELGQAVEAGLPNITGQTGIIAAGGPGDASNVSGAITYTNYSTHQALDSGGDRWARYGIDASLSNSIYGKSNTVQPDTIKYYYYIVVATITKTDIEVDIDNIASDINNIASDINNINSKLGTTYSLIKVNEIPANSDLNNYTTAGNYTCGGDSNTATLLNCPTGNAFTMIVRNILNNNLDFTGYTYIVQEITDWYANKWVRKISRDPNYIDYGQWQKIETSQGNNIVDRTLLSYNSEINKYSLLSKQRIAYRGYVPEIRYYPIFKINAVYYNTGLADGIQVKGRIGGYGALDIVPVDFIVASREGEKIITTGQDNSFINAYNSEKFADLVLPIITRNSDNTSTFYLRCNSWFVFDLTLEPRGCSTQNYVEFLYDTNNYLTEEQYNSSTTINRNYTDNLLDSYKRNSGMQFVASYEFSGRDSNVFQLTNKNDFKDYIWKIYVECAGSNGSSEYHIDIKDGAYSGSSFTYTHMSYGTSGVGNYQGQGNVLCDIGSSYAFTAEVTIDIAYGGNYAIFSCLYGRGIDGQIGFSKLEANIGNRDMHYFAFAPNYGTLNGCKFTVYRMRRK